MGWNEGLFSFPLWSEFEDITTIFHILIFKLPVGKRTCFQQRALLTPSSYLGTFLEAAWTSICHHSKFSAMEFPSIHYRLSHFLPCVSHHEHLYPRPGGKLTESAHSRSTRQPEFHSTIGPQPQYIIKTALLCHISASCIGKVNAILFLSFCCQCFHAF